MKVIGWVLDGAVIPTSLVGLEVEDTKVKKRK
jgi:hypothetical protein